MKLAIEEWAKVNLDENALPLFDEAISCYKIGAFKSAYLMSYLSFKITIRERIIKSKYHPDTYTDTEWEKTIVTKLEEDDHWEEFLNSIIGSNPQKDTTNSKKFASIFCFENRDNTLNKYVFFKNIRNSCAHAKKEIINAATVEQFWNYIEDNLSEFYVLGGQKYLISEVANSYKYRKTEEYLTKLKRLVKDISIVYDTNSSECFKEGLKNAGIILEAEDVEFWSELVNSEIESIQNGFVGFLMQDISHFVEFYRLFPQILLKAHSLDEKFIQDTVNQYFIYNGDYSKENQELYWGLLYECLCKYNKYIDFKKISDKYCYGVSNVDFTKEQVEVFREKKVFNKFLDGYYSWFFKVEYEDIKSNGNRYFELDAKNLFDYVFWDKDIIRKLSNAISRLEDRRSTNYYGSWEIRRSELFREVVETNSEFINAVLTKEGFPVCDKLLEYLSKDKVEV